MSKKGNRKHSKTLKFQKLIKKSFYISRVSFVFNNLAINPTNLQDMFIETIILS